MYNVRALMSFTVPESLQMACIWALETFLAQDGRPDAKVRPPVLSLRSELD
jgi:hypothetical protein